ncbi:MAG: DUF3592 domain-containing protein [Solobacterium sp.]|nr:DUF3592 domain-containing protein [Solobacterium sp.]
MDKTIGILLWIVLGILAFFVFGYTTLMKKRIAKDGLETSAVVTKIEELLDPDTITSDYRWYVEYYDEKGERQQGMLFKCPDLKVGDKVRIKYHPKNHNYAEYVRQL